MVNVTVTGDVVKLVRTPVTLSDPLTGIPVTATLLSLVQLKVVPLPPPLPMIGVTVAPEQIVCVKGAALTAPVIPGFTNTVAVTGVPVQPLAVGVMVNVTVTGDAVVFVNAPAIVFPLPEAAMPVTETVLFLVQV